MFLMISCGCAECRFDGRPLIGAELFNSLEKAKDSSWVENSEWKEHPQGGWYISSGEGDDWIIEVPEGFVLKPMKE